MAMNRAAKLAALKRAAQKARDKGPEREEPGETEPAGSTATAERAEEDHELG